MWLRLTQTLAMITIKAKPRKRNFMSKFQVGDVLFRIDGRPVRFNGVKPETGKIELDSDKKTVKDVIRHGYINGLSEGDRSRFNTVMDEVREIRDPIQQVEELKAKIENLNGDPKNNTSLTKYLRAEMAHIMNVNNIQPRFYQLDEYKTR